MANMGRALLAGLVGGFSQYAGMKMDEKTKAEQAERDQKLAQLQMQLKQSEAKFSESLKAPQYQTIKDTGPDGVTRERTIKSSYDANSGRQEQDVGTAVIPVKDDRNAAQVEYDMYNDNPGKYAEWQQAKGKSAGKGEGSGRRSLADQANERLALSPEQRRALDEASGRKAAIDQGETARSTASADTKKAMAEFDASGEKMRIPLLASMRIDPADPNAREKYREAYKADALKNEFGDVFSDVSSGAKTVSEPAKAGASKANPVKASDLTKEPTEPTWVQMPNGTVQLFPRK